MTDVGLQSLELIHKANLIDEEWTERGAREFSWIAHRLKQAVKASRPFDDDGITLTRLSAQTTVVEDVSAEPEVVLAVLSHLNRHAIGNCYSYDANRDSIVASTVSHVHADTVNWRVPQVASYAIAQLCFAETDADYLASETGGQVAVRAHNSAGARHEPDDMLNVLEDVFAIEGRQPSRFENLFEFETIADISRGTPRVATLGADRTGLALEVAFADYTSLAMLRTNAPHRRIGKGLLADVRLPSKVTVEDAHRIADFLNRRESTGDALSTHYGAWYADVRPEFGLSVAYQFFVPNRLYLPGIAQDSAYSCVGRARWADRMLNGKMSEREPWKLLAARLEKFSDE